MLRILHFLLKQCKSSYSYSQALQILPSPVSSQPIVAQQSSTRWFEKEVYSQEPALKSYLHGAFPSVHDIDDVVQESYLRIWKARVAQPISSAKAYLFKVARHVALDIIRREKISPISSVTDLAALSVIDNGPGVVETACSREEIVLLARAIDQLPSRCREIVILRKLKGVPQKIIAAQLGISEQTVQVQVARGMKRCDQYLRDHGVRRSSEHGAE